MGAIWRNQGRNGGGGGGACRWFRLHARRRTGRIASDGATSSVALGAAPAAVVADARRIWFAMPGKLVYCKPNGTKEGEVVLETWDFLTDAMRPLDPASLAIDAYGRVWALDRKTGDLLPVWGKRSGE